MRFFALASIFLIFLDLRAKAATAQRYPGQKIYLILLDEDIEPEVSEAVSRAIRERFSYEIGVLKRRLDPRFAYNPQRKQYYSTRLLEKLRKGLPQDTRVALGITTKDLYVPQLNFVFGEAWRHTKMAIISLHRLRPEFYGQERDQELFCSRARKEAIHELGHAFGLKHCPNKHCVMHFSNSIADTDYKTDDFCPACRKNLTP